MPTVFSYNFLYSSVQGGFHLGKVRLRDLNPGEVLIRPRYVGICGSDFHTKAGYVGDELCLGHEWVGQVIAAHPSVCRFAAKQWVTSGAFLGCGRCEECRIGRENWCQVSTILGNAKLGALTSRLILNERSLARISRSHGSGGVLFEVIAVAETVAEVAKVGRESRRAVIIGAGPVGLLVGLALKKLQFDVLMIETLRRRRKLAGELGLAALAPKSMAKLLGLGTQPLVIDAAGDFGSDGSAFAQALSLVRRGGRVIAVGKYSSTRNINCEIAARRGLRITWIRGAPHSSLEIAVKRWTKKMPTLSGLLISREYGCRDILLAFKDAENRRHSGKVTIKLPENDEDWAALPKSFNP